jgi:hypothetical protein
LLFDEGGRWGKEGAQSAVLMRRVKGMAKVRNVAWRLDRLVMNGINRLTKRGIYGYWAHLGKIYISDAHAHRPNLINLQMHKLTSDTADELSTHGKHAVSILYVRQIPRPGL